MNVYSKFEIDEVLIPSVNPNLIFFLPASKILGSVLDIKIPNLL